MIYTLTLSPSSDLFISSQNFELSKVNRYQKFELLPGGKGLNASIILQRNRFKNQAITTFDKQTFLSFQHFFNQEKLNIFNVNNPSKRE